MRSVLTYDTRFHSNEFPCEGTALAGGLALAWQSEPLGHSGTRALGLEGEGEGEGELVFQETELMLARYSGEGGGGGGWSRDRAGSWSHKISRSVLNETTLVVVSFYFI